MAAYPTYSASDVAGFSGRPEGLYPPVYTPNAIVQALLLFKLATCLTEWPEDEDMAQLAQFAILSMAENLVLAHEYAGIAASPMQSETIGSYSYSKVSAKVKLGEDTGIAWFDMAVQRLGVCETGDNVAGAKFNLFAYDMPVVINENGDQFVLGPRNDPAYNQPAPGYYPRYH